MVHLDNLKFNALDHHYITQAIPHLTFHFKYKYIPITNLFYIMYIMHSCPLIYIYIRTTFVKATFSKSIIFKVKNIFEPNVLKWVIKRIIINSSPLAFLVINVKVFNFQKEWCTFSRKKRTFEKNKDCILLRFECFENAKTFLICTKLWACKFCN